MTIHVLHAGDGYLYLLRSVATHDRATAPGRSLASYYTGSGQPPGSWAGRLSDILEVRGTVTEEQMRLLFGQGLHPNATMIREALIHRGMSPEDADRAVRLGRRFPVYGHSPSHDQPIALAFRQRERAVGRRLTDEEKVEIRQGVLAEEFARRAGRNPIDPLELDSFEGSTNRAAVAGYDFVFTPVKSVAVLWGVGSAETRSQIHEAHRAAVADALEWLERSAAFTRAGTEGQAQIDTSGVIAAVFDHWDSRAGDPDLHTHVAISNKVQGADGKWRSLDGRALFAAAVSLSERYNTRIEDELRSRLRVSFAERSGKDEGHRTVREIVGVPGALIAHFSKRRRDIEGGYRELLAAYRAEHGHDPSDAARLKLYQQATLSERPEKQLGRSLQQMVEAWRQEATTVLGVADVEAFLECRVHGASVELPQPEIQIMADEVLRVLSSSRSTWNVHHVRAEAQRQSRAVSTSDRDELVEQIVAAAMDPSRSIRIQPLRTSAEPPQLRRADGESVFVEHGSARFTTNQILDAEERIVAASRELGAAAADRGHVAEALSAGAAEGRALNAGQERMVRAFCLSRRVVQLGLAPAGSGKTTAMEAVAHAWRRGGRKVVALAPSAAAAEVLSSELGVTADTVAKFDHDQPEIKPGTLILIDEAGLAGTLILDRIVARAQTARAVVRLVGDDQQLGAIEAGGVIRQIAHQVGAVRMEQVVRFADDAEARATLWVRNGEPAAVDFYVNRGRVVAGTDETNPAAAYDAWLSDVRAGRNSALLASSSAEVAALNARARSDRVVAGLVTVDGMRLHDGNVAGAGDWIVTRRNERLLAVHAGRDWVKNGDSWTVERVHDDGALTVVHRGHHGRVTLPPDYVRSQVELDYARTIRRSQGLTVDRAHLVVDPRMKREDLYVGLSRARQSTHLYVTVMTDPGPDHQPDVAGSAAEVLKAIIARTGIELSAGETIREAISSADDLHRMAVEYEHALDVQTGDRYRTAADRIHPGLTADPAWPNVVRRMHRAEAAGRAVDEVLTAAEQMSGWGGAISETEVMAHRLDRLLGREDHHRTEPDVPEWLAASPPQHMAAPWDTYLPGRYAEMADRIASLAADAERGQPTWLAAIGHGTARTAAMRQVVAYRAVYDIATDDPLGPEPQRRTRQHHAWSAAHEAIRRSHSSESADGATRLLASLTAGPPSLDDRPSTDHRGPTRAL